MESHRRWWERYAARSSGPVEFVFVPDGEQRTSAELSPEEKDLASHRGRAMRALLPHLRDLT